MDDVANKMSAAAEPGTGEEESGTGTVVNAKPYPSAPPPPTRDLTDDPWVPGPEPGTLAHVAAGGTYPNVDKTQPFEPDADAAGRYFSSPPDLLTQLRTHIQGSHGLAVDTQMMKKVHDYLAFHLNEEGYL